VSCGDGDAMLLLSAHQQLVSIMCQDGRLSLSAVHRSACVRACAPWRQRVRVGGAKMTDPPRWVRRHERSEGRRRGLRGARQLAADGKCSGDWGMQWCTEMSQPFSYGCPDPNPLFPVRRPLRPFWRLF
jgi:hypothetical protein